MTILIVDDIIKVFNNRAINVDNISLRDIKVFNDLESNNFNEDINVIESLNSKSINVDLKIIIKDVNIIKSFNNTTNSLDEIIIITRN